MWAEAAHNSLFTIPPCLSFFHTGLCYGLIWSKDIFLGHRPTGFTILNKSDQGQSSWNMLHEKKRIYSALNMSRDNTLGYFICSKIISPFLPV